MISVSLCSVYQREKTSEGRKRRKRHEREEPSLRLHGCQRKAVHQTMRMLDQNDLTWYAFYIDILPMGKPRGLPLSRAGFPASRRPARIGFHRSWSYSLSTGSHRKPCGQNVTCGIDITVMLDATFGASPETNIKR